MPSLQLFPHFYWLKKRGGRPEPPLHFQLNLAGAKETVNVSGAPVIAPTYSATPTTLVSRLDIERTPGLSRSNSLAMITDYVPGSYVTHDQLHIRGGHQTSWLVDGVPVPNTNIASNLGPQVDPKDIDYMEVNRGSYTAEFGDGTYGVFIIVPRTGFERNNEGELVLSAGNFYETNAQLSFGSHSERFASYARVNGNRSDLGLQAPVPAGGSRCHQWIWRLRLIHLECESLQSTPLGNLAAEGLLPNSLRSQPKRHRKRADS